MQKKRINKRTIHLLLTFLPNLDTLFSKYWRERFHEILPYDHKLLLIERKIIIGGENWIDFYYRNNLVIRVCLSPEIQTKFHFT